MIGDVECLKQTALRIVDGTISLNPLGGGGIGGEFGIRNRSGQSFIIEKHYRGGEYGLVVYPDGTWTHAGSRDILHRRRDDGGSDWRDGWIDRVVAGRPPAGYLFIPQSRYGVMQPELETIFRAMQVRSEVPMAHGTAGSGLTQYNPIGREVHLLLLDKLYLR